MKDRLEKDVIDGWLRERSGWTGDEDALGREFRFPTFPAAIAFVNRVAELAELANHHPDIDVRYDRVRLRLSSHDADGVTERDLALAEKIDSAAQN